MKERPILLSAPMVRAVMSGTKTQTRRAVKPVGKDEGFVIIERDDTSLWPFRSDDGESTFHTVKRGGAEYLDETPHDCPYGQPGDRLWVREAWRSTTDLDPHSGSRIAEMCMDAGYRKPWAPIQYEADGERINWEHTSTPPHDGLPKEGRYRHARFMPRWASRILLEIVSVRIERLKDICEADAEAEGIDYLRHHPDTDETLTARQLFECLWSGINGPDSWAANPWVWVIEFKRVSE